MKRFALVLAMLPCLPAVAGWEVVAENDESVHYVDWATLKAVRDTRKVWSLIDMRDNMAGRGNSKRSLTEFDCLDWRWRYLQSTDFAGQMAGGESLIELAKPSPWRYIAPGSIGELEAKRACTLPPVKSPAKR